MAERRFTDLELERSLAGDLPPDRARALEREATDADRARLDELRAEHQAYLGAIDVDAEVRRIEQRAARIKPEPRVAWWRWMVGGGILVAAAAAALVFVRPGKPAPDDREIKGGDISLIIHTPSRQLASGDTVAPGERIRFEINAGRPGHVAIVGVDASGAQTVYVPYGGTAAASFDPGARVLPGAIQLDAAPGDETFYALYSEQPFAITPGIATAPPPQLRVAKVTLHKQ